MGSFRLCGTAGWEQRRPPEGGGGYHGGGGGLAARDPRSYIEASYPTIACVDTIHGCIALHTGPCIHCILYHRAEVPVPVCMNLCKSAPRYNSTHACIHIYIYTHTSAHAHRLRVFASVKTLTCCPLWYFRRSSIGDRLPASIFRESKHHGRIQLRSSLTRGRFCKVL